MGFRKIRFSTKEENGLQSYTNMPGARAQFFRRNAEKETSNFTVPRENVAKRGQKKSSLPETRKSSKHHFHKYHASLTLKYNCVIL